MFGLSGSQNSTDFSPQTQILISHSFLDKYYIDDCIYGFTLNDIYMFFINNGHGVLD